MTNQATVSTLWRYPVKSMMGEELNLKYRRVHTAVRKIPQCLGKKGQIPVIITKI